jgi:hypothetical protein
LALPLNAAHAAYLDRIANLDLKPSDLAIRPGSLYYAVDHRTSTYWAAAAFLPSATKAS